MAISAFSEIAFARAIRAGDSRRFGIDLKHDRDAIIDAAISEIEDGPKLAPFTTGHLRGKPLVSYTRFNDHLVLRSVTSHLQWRFRIVLPNRDRIVRGIIEALMDETPMYILRRDVSSFYETITVGGLREQLLSDTGSPARVRNVIGKYFETHCVGGLGLPRGVGLSAILAELAMAEFDQKVRSLEGVYRYYRYSDDIIIFSYVEPTNIAKALEEALVPPMTFNPRKSYDLSLAEQNKQLSKDLSFEYLGYQFAFSNLSGRGTKKGRVVRVSIAPKKIARLKSRVIVALQSYKRWKDFPLLRDRLRFVTSNYMVRRRGLKRIGGSPHIRSGIYYSYHLCGVYTASIADGHSQRIESDCSELKHLDGFLHSLLQSGNSKYSTVLKTTLSVTRLQQLKSLSFYQGFRQRIFVRLTPARVGTIKAIWKNV